MISEALRRRVESSLGQGVRAVLRVTGGDINDAFELRLADQRSIFLKTNAQAPAAMFRAEARGLEFLRQARALRIPELLAVSPTDEAPPFLRLVFSR
ncbi:MAG TPA: fructosamine kinase family protein, partial [Polyangiaceae bacterium]